jgi:hypothetical protein
MAAPGVIAAFIFVVAVIAGLGGYGLYHDSERRPT